MPKDATIIRWTIYAASMNFDVDAKTLTKQMQVAGVLPGEDGKFSTMDICRSIFGDLKGDLVRAQTRDTNKAADIKAVNLANLLRQNIPSEIVEKAWSSVIIDMRQKILYAEIPDKIKQDILKDLMAMPIDEYFKDAKPEGNEDEPE
jgi:hypothetical protein